MPSITVPDPTDLGTLRPDEPAITTPGAKFTPLEVADRPTHIYLPDNVTPLDPYSLFEQYYTLEIIESFVKATNDYERKCRPTKRACGKGWYKTIVQEIYIFFAVQIYMIVINMIQDYATSLD